MFFFSLPIPYCLQPGKKTTLLAAPNSAEFPVHRCYHHLGLAFVAGEAAWSLMLKEAIRYSLIHKSTHLKDHSKIMIYSLEYV